MHRHRKSLHFIMKNNPKSEGTVTQKASKNEHEISKNINKVMLQKGEKKFSSEG
jgi:hypothetical protein